MKKYIKHPLTWVIKNKISSLLNQSVNIDNIPHYDVGQNPIQGNMKSAANE